MNKKRSRVFRTVLAGTAQLLAGITAIVIFLVAFVLQLAFSIGSGSGAFSPGAHILSALLTVGLLFYCAIRNFSLSSRFRKVLGRVNKDKVSSPVPVAEIASLLSKSEEEVLDELQVMAGKDFFPMPVQVDLYRRELIPGAEAPPVPDPEEAVLYKESYTRSKFPLLVFLLSFAACFLGLHGGDRTTTLVAALAVGLLCLFVSHKGTVRVKRLSPVKKKAEPKQDEPVRTGDKETDEALATARKQLEEMNRLGRSIINPTVDQQVGEMVAISRQIFDYVREHPEKLRQIRQFMNYYLPTTLRLLDSYDQFSQHQVKGENVRQSLEKIENMLENIKKAFQKELDNLYLDKALDISADIDVMQAMLETEGIGKEGTILNMDIPPSR